MKKTPTVTGSSVRPPTKSAAEKAAATPDVVIEPALKAVAPSSAGTGAASTTGATAPRTTTPRKTSTSTKTTVAKTTAAKTTAAKTTAAKSAAAARATAAKTTAAKTAAAKTTAAKTTAAKTTAAKTAAARTTAAKSAATKATAAKTTARTAASRAATAKTTAARTAAAKAAAAKADAAAAAAEIGASEAVAPAETIVPAEVIVPAEAIVPAQTAESAETSKSVEISATADAAAPDTSLPETIDPEPIATEQAPAEPAPVEEAPSAPVVAEEPVPNAASAEEQSAPAETSSLDEPASDVDATREVAASSVPAISIRGLVKQFGDNRAIHGIDLTVPAGSFYGVVGPNGAGKTTTLSIVAGLLRADAGSVTICGIDQAVDPLAAKRVMGVLPDRLRTFDRLTGRQLLYYYGLLRGLASDVIEKRAADLARAFDLGDALGRVVSDYSAGMTKKVMLAGAMIHSPRVLVLDEPFESVDPVSSAVILDILRAYVSHGGTVILSSHGMDLVERVCSRVAIIVDGEVLAEGTIDEVRAGQTLEARFVELSGGIGEVEGLEWLHTFSD
ncbi:ATP-binding cassette domain-containing protein [Microbacterium sp. NPDC087665]|uniref:ABC transporter ATP-binding protein n=1 Tax=Microbacterium sp. NPDC087665 TaxID=3364194 RepID=UPI00381EB9E2